MSRRPDESGEMRRLVFNTLCELTAEGHDRVGPTMIAERVREKTKRVLQTTLITFHLKKLCEEGKAERLPQGPKKALYRIVETI